jgi:hypothetical protein
MNTCDERTDENFPDTISYAVLTVDGELRFDSTPSNHEFKDEGGWVTLYHHGPWDAVRETIGGPCRRLARAPIGNGLMAWVADESLVRPDPYPLNEIGGRTVNILTAFAQSSGAKVVEPGDDPWGGTIVITSLEDRGHDRWCGFIWPLDGEDEWLIREAWRAASGDDMSTLYTDDLEPLDDDEPAGPVLRWERAPRTKGAYVAVGPAGDIWLAMNLSYERGGDMGRWRLSREPRGGRLRVEGEFDPAGGPGDQQSFHLRGEDSARLAQCFRNDGAPVGR